MSNSNSSSKFDKSFRGSPTGREEKHILRERLSKVKSRVSSRFLLREMGDV